MCFSFFRQIECLGDDRRLPQKSLIRDEWHERGAYFIVSCDLPVKALIPIMGEMIRDNDILKRHFLAAKPKPDLPTSCTLGEEMLPPSERPSIQKMIVEGYRPVKFAAKPWSSNTGMDYYPFKR
jgi:hypothetical protein